jgi:hypothetical protein
MQNTYEHVSIVSAHIERKSVTIYRKEECFEQKA